MMFDSTICAPATTVGGAVAMVRVSGPQALSIADKVIRPKHGTLAGAKGYSLKFAEIPDGEGVLDEVLVSVFRSPESYTGEDAVEISCHASEYIVSRMLDLLCGAGCRMAEPGEFTRRAFLNGKMDLSQAEAVADVIAASSEASHRVAMSQMKGAFSLELKALRAKLVELSALLELELDFSEEDVEFAGRDELRKLLSQTSERVADLAGSFKLGNAIRNGVPVAIVGEVNTGKSTLLNALVGDDRAIVSPIPGTTRDTVEETMVIEGITCRFIDTAGLRETEDYVEKKGIERSRQALSRSSLVIGVIDGSCGIEKQIEAACAVRALVPSEANLILVRNKMDLMPVSASETVGAEGLDGVIDISAKEGNGIDRLLSEIGRLVKGTDDSAGRTIVTNKRHYEALVNAGDALGRASVALSAGLSPDLVAEELREAIRALGRIFGEGLISPDEVLGEIFGRFCIGK